MFLALTAVNLKFILVFNCCRYELGDQYVRFVFFRVSFHKVQAGLVRQSEYQLNVALDHTLFLIYNACFNEHLL